MRIPLDYYRILGIPIQADGQQLSQAYHDRALQLPRREYSDLAINTRKQLLDEAYSVLANPEERSRYDANFLNSPDPQSPSLEINNNQLLGALLLLHELGEYELVLQLAQPLIDPKAKLPPEQAELVNNRLVRADIVLTLALASLELGREQWQQGASEQAAHTAHYGQELLLREGLFANIRGEIQADLYKLRPYRILELLTRENGDEASRAQGMKVLLEMLEDRGGIDGTKDDQSGLDLDDFLRFIQQLRSYLTTAEQQELFELEARRPSAVAMYLAVYALIARGFAYGQPQLIAQAQDWLGRLGRRQDVHLEQAICALLLGQTEAANRELEQSQDHEPLQFIQTHSQDAPDLLPGLCLYGERWLQTEVFPHFQDLAYQTVALKDYFADASVQSYLEQLPGEGETPGTQNQWAVVESHLTAAAMAPNPELTVGAALQAEAAAAANPAIPQAAVLETPRPPRLRERPPVSEAEMPVARRSASAHPSPRRSPRSKQTPRLILLGAGGVIGVAIAGFLIAQLWQLLFNRPEEAIETPIPEVTPLAIEPPAPEIPDPNAPPTPIAATDPLDLTTGGQVVETWLKVKTLAFGPDYQVEALDLILAEPLRTQWRQLAEGLQGNNTYREYEHRVEVETVNVDPDDPNQAVVEAAVREASTEYVNGQPNPAASYDDNLRVRYEVVREGEQWLIENMQVLQ
ncbi:IMS domain-containing protein [Spirulina sp. CCNP1310]|uniref:IMS domain-containing protein n=1 Tax=Spirulina sp. CCNP1310 TaxID=3110249 RepID=UPI002B1FFB29|nr:IMS domain-containing protein [Spirulina sp. CCNP1310]MEA5421554.1 IMS domain-containing protein [Spirulina sp. CCNP1310]